MFVCVVCVYIYVNSLGLGESGNFAIVVVGIPDSRKVNLLGLKGPVTLEVLNAHCLDRVVQIHTVKAILHPIQNLIREDTGNVDVY